ncbi:MAG: 3-phosphoglycerate dehydrogenase [Dehalococcoidia bacterium]|nr:3-phosphoglycerate dehydrogenase [Dehalococcoidia bacterium]
MKHALVLAPFDGDCLARLRQRLRVTHESWLDTGELHDPAVLARRLRDDQTSYLVVEADFVFEDVMQQAPLLEMIGVCRNALNHIDLDAATQRGILVVNALGRNAMAVAELTIGLMLGLARPIAAAHRHIVERRWQDPVAGYTQFRGVELAGKTAGIIGLGAIGRLVAQRLRAFDMRVIAHDPFVSAEQAAKSGVSLTDLDRLLADSDYVLIHAAAAEATMGLIGEAQLARMKPMARLVNTSAAGVVDEQALIAALAAHRIAGAALDVFEGQPLPESSPLLALDNVLLTPHMGGATAETVLRQSAMISEDILLALDGKQPRRLVNAAAWATWQERHGRAATQR